MRWFQKMRGEINVDGAPFIVSTINGKVNSLVK